MKLFNYQSKVVNQTKSYDGHEALQQCITEQFTIIRFVEPVIQESKGQHSIEVEENHTQ